MMVRGETIRQVGPLDEGFFMYCEEIDWCFRMKAAGWQVFCVPQAKIIHHVARSTQQFRDQMFIELWKSRLRLFSKHYSPFYRWAVRKIIRLGIGYRMSEVRRADLEEPERESRLRAYREVCGM